jgi:SAM-dependent MidA family methyltransferase
MTRGPAITTLPELDATQRAHSDATRAHIEARVAASGGWLPFDEYMELALYAPGLGYYSAGATKFGAAGDFVTAPEISDLFSRALAAQFADILRELGGESRASILELGAGSGRLAGVVLRELATLQQSPSAYSILEVSADLIERQRATVTALAGGEAARAHWLERLPMGHSGVIVANEVLDALPTDRFVLRAGGPLRLGVAVGASGLQWAERAPVAGDPADAAWLREVQRVLGDLREPLPEGYVGEICPRIDAWVGALGAALERGVVMLIDYGLPRRHYYHPDRVRGSLRCHFRHRAHEDPFSHPGLTDITAWVDFTRVAEAADAAGLEVAGFSTQAAALLSLGIERLAHTEGSRAESVQQSQGLQKLLLPGEMGEAVKVMMLTRGIRAPLRGVRLQDLRGSL